MPGLVEDLVARPGLEVDRALGLDLLAAVDLPGVGLVVGDERVGVEELEHVALDGGVRPGLFLEEADGGLVAVEGRAQLAFLDQGPGPEGVVAGARGPLRGCGRTRRRRPRISARRRAFRRPRGRPWTGAEVWGCVGHGWILRASGARGPESPATGAALMGQGRSATTAYSPAPRTARRTARAAADGPRLRVFSVLRSFPFRSGLFMRSSLGNPNVIRPKLISLYSPPLERSLSADQFCIEACRCVAVAAVAYIACFHARPRE